MLLVVVVGTVVVALLVVVDFMFRRIGGRHPLFAMLLLSSLRLVGLSCCFLLFAVFASVEVIAQQQL